MIKSLTVTEDAYDSLKVLKHGDESFSEVILRLSSQKIGAAAKFFGALKNTEVARVRESIKKRRVAIEKEVAERRETLRKRFSHDGS